MSLLETAVPGMQTLMKLLLHYCCCCCCDGGDGLVRLTYHRLSLVTAGMRLGLVHDTSTVDLVNAMSTVYVGEGTV